MKQQEKPVRLNRLFFDITASIGNTAGTILGKLISFVAYFHKSSYKHKSCKYLK